MGERIIMTFSFYSDLLLVFCKDGVRSGGQESDLTVGRVTVQLSFRVLHGAGDGTVHESSHSELRNAQFAFQHRVLDQRETGRPGAKMNPTANA